MKKILVSCIIMAVLALPALCMAETGTTEIEEVVVTATRSEAPVAKIGGSSLTVITAEDIAARQQHTVEEVLKSVPGLDIVANGGPGTLSSVFLRGADSKNTLVMIDGVMYNDPSGANRGAKLANITVDNIERIEVVRGPLSVLYGSNATAGVVNIITKKGKGKPSVYAGVEGGSYDTYKMYGGSSGAISKLNYSVAASYTDTAGFSIADDDNDQILHDGNTSEKDGWENTTFSAKLGVDITPNFDVNGTVRRQDSEVENDDYSSTLGYAGDQFAGTTPQPDGKKLQWTDSDETLYKFDVNNRFLDGMFNTSFYYQATDADRIMYDSDGQKDSEFFGNSSEYGGQGAFNYNNLNILTVGASYFKEEMETSTITPKEADLTSIWGQDQLYILPGLDLVAGVRHDDHEKFGGKTTYRVAPAYTIEQTQTVLKVSYGTGFRAPSLFELFSSYGNEELKPETSVGWDAGFEQILLDNNIKFGATYFNLRFDDRIAYDFATSKYQQAEGTTKTSGIEAFVQWSPIADLDLQLNYTYSHAKDPDGIRLVRRPLNKLFFNARYRLFEKARVNLDVRWVDERDANTSSKDKDGNQVKNLDAYTLVNVSASYDITKWLQVYGRIDNLFDTFYEEAWSYAAPGFSAYGGIKLSYN